MISEKSTFVNFFPHIHLWRSSAINMNTIFPLVFLMIFYTYKRTKVEVKVLRQLQLQDRHGYFNKEMSVMNIRHS